MKLTQQIFGPTAIVAALLLLSSTPGWCEELTGTVIKTSGKQVSIKLDGDLMPQIGDSVTIGFMLDSIGFVPLKGKWKVSEMDSETVTADPVGETKQPQNEQLVKINCTTPQTIQAFNEKADEFDIKGEDFHNGRNGQEKNSAKAIEPHRQVAAHGSADSMASLDYMYANAIKGDAIAQNDLGSKYRNGNGVNQDYAEAARWFYKAAEQGNAKAELSLGIFFDNGFGMDQNPVEALKWFRKASDHGEAAADFCIGVMYFYGRGVSKNFVEAAMWYRKSADQGFTRAQYVLGTKYENGIGVKQDLSQATLWYRQAASKGDSDAQKALSRLGRN
jgi:hypothetical protein